MVSAVSDGFGVTASADSRAIADWLEEAAPIGRSVDRKTSILSIQPNPAMNLGGF
jgi:hypothetical protein